MSIHTLPHGKPYDHGAGDGSESPMALSERVAKIEATLETILPTLATKSDMEMMRADVHKEFNAQTWKFITWMSTIAAALVAATYFIATHVS